MPRDAGIETREGEPLQLRAALTPSTANDTERTIELTWSTGSEVRRYDWRTDREYVEALDMSAKSIRLERLNEGGPVLDSHRNHTLSAVIGAVVPGTARADGTLGTARVKFSERDEVTPIWRDVKAGIIRSVSVGYRVHKWQVTAAQGDQLERRTAVDWEPYEISMVAIPADAGAKTRNLRVRSNVSEENETEPQEQDRTAPDAGEPAPGTALAERQRVQWIMEMCKRTNITDAERDAWIDKGVSTRAVGDAILDKMAARSRETHISPATGGDGRRELSARDDARDALLVRAGLAVEGNGHRHFGDGDLREIARRVLEMGGVNTRTLSRNEIAQRALTTGDFAAILALAGEKLVRKGYEAFPLIHREVFRKTTSSDFKLKHRIANDAVSILPEVPEGGVIPRTGASTEKAAYALKSYGSIIAVTRHLIINDDFDAVANAARQRGRSAAETERKLVWDYVTQSSFAGPTAPDGHPLFDNTNHANFPAASATPITTGTLAAARAALRAAKSIGGFAINADLAHIVVSGAGENDFDQLLNGLYVPTAASTAITSRMRSVKLHVEPLIHATKKHWYGFTHFDQVDTFEYAYLAGAEGPRLEQRIGFEVEGVEFKVALDFGVGIIDHRGCYMQRET